jgi:hypothetical protein
MINKRTIQHYARDNFTNWYFFKYTIHEPHELAIWFDL